MGKWWRPWDTTAWFGLWVTIFRTMALISASLWSGLKSVGLLGSRVMILSVGGLSVLGCPVWS